MKDVIFDRQIIYGCMGLGGSWDSDGITKEDQALANNAVDAAMENGINWFDHADIYRKGKAEKVFGNILKDRPSLREEIILQSKAGIRIGESYGGSNYYNLRKDYLIQSVEEILKRLNTDYLDFFLLHRPDPLVHPHEIAEAFHELKTRELVKYFGVSNMSADQISLLEHFSIPVLTNQVQLSLEHNLVLEPGVTVNTKKDIPFSAHGLAEWSLKHNKPLQAWGSLDQGKFTREGDDSTSRMVNDLAAKYATSKESIVLSWLYRLPFIVQPVIGTTNTERIKACAEAENVELTHKEWYDLWISARGEKLP